MSSQVVVAHTLDAHEFSFCNFSTERRNEVCALIAAHDIDPNRTRAVTYEVIDAPLLRFTLYATDERGRIKLNAAGDDGETYDVDRALSTPLPDWWQPVPEQARQDARRQQ